MCPQVFLSPYILTIHHTKFQPSNQFCRKSYISGGKVNPLNTVQLKCSDMVAERNVSVGDVDQADMLIDLNLTKLRQKSKGVLNSFCILLALLKLICRHQ